MKLNKFAYLYSKPLGNHTSKNNKKIYWKFTKKNLEKSWKYHGILSVQKSGNPEYSTVIIPSEFTHRILADAEQSPKDFSE